jgi:hypothetical protein
MLKQRGHAAYGHLREDARDLERDTPTMRVALMQLTSEVMFVEQL